MIVNSGQQASSGGQTPSSSLPDSVPMRSVASSATNVQLRRADSAKSGPNLASSSISSSNNNNLNLSSTNRNTNKNRPNQFANITTGSVSMPSMINSLPTTYNNPPNVTTQSESSNTTSLPPHVVCSRYFLFLVYFLLLLSLIVNTFLHFIFYGSNMSIGALFLDVHHRHELVTGDYYSLDPYTRETQLNWPGTSHSSPTSHQGEMLHCDRDSFLSLLDDFYHIPKPTYDSSSGVYNQDHLAQPNGQIYNRTPPNKSKPYPKIFADFKNYARPNNDQKNKNDEELYYSSSSTSGEKMESARASRIASANESLWRRRNRHEQRLLVIEVVALILLFITVLTQVLGLIGVLKRNLVILLLVTVVDSLLLSALIFVANLGLILLLLIAICVGFYFVFQLKVGIAKEVKHKQRQRELMTTDVRECINASCGRLTPCIHVSLEQYEAMTQQMLHRYSSPIVYCPHYNESLC